MPEIPKIGTEWWLMGSSTGNYFLKELLLELMPRPINGPVKEWHPLGACATLITSTLEIEFYYLLP